MPEIDLETGKVRYALSMISPFDKKGQQKYEDMVLLTRIQDSIDTYIEDFECTPLHKTLSFKQRRLLKVFYKEFKNLSCKEKKVNA